MDKSTTSAFTTYATFETQNSQKSKYHFPSMTTERPRIYGEQALDDRYEYITNNNLETLLNAIEASPVDLPPKKYQIAKQSNTISPPSHLSSSKIQKPKPQLPPSPTPPTSYNHHQLEEHNSSIIISKDRIHAHRLLPPPPINKSMSISSLIELDQHKPIHSSSIPLTPPDSSLIFPEISIAQTKSSIDSIPFPRLQPPSSNIFLNSFQLPSVNQAIGDIDHTRNSSPPLISNNNKRKWEATENSFVNGLMSIDDRYAVEETRSKMRRSIDDLVCETEEKDPLELKASLDENMKGTFKYLHVSGTAKAKHFTLKLKIFHNNSITPYITRSLISLFNRINSQTVRTKYMGIEGGVLCAKNSSWSSFTITMVNSNNNNANGMGAISQSNSSSVTNSSDSTPITYGSEIILSDPASGFISDRLIIRKVEKGKIAQGACGPVSQMQKIALQAVRSGTREPHYLSAAGPITMDGPRSQEQCAVGSASPFLGYQSSKVVHIQNTEFIKEPFRMVSIQSSILSNKNDTSNPVVVEEVDDYLCWTIVGI
ncbi:2748_t:CDS:2, partial [Acaulospora colombiana]